MLKKIISGGQTGADIAGLEAAAKLKIKTGGYCPKGFLTENGKNLSLKYFNLKELPTQRYDLRTIKNILKSNGTVIFCKTDSHKNIIGKGTLFTYTIAVRNKKPIIINPNKENFIRWLIINKIHTLNVAGNRESQYPGLNKIVKSFLIESLISYYNSYKFIKAIYDLSIDNKSGSVSILNKFIKIIKNYLNTKYQKDILIENIEYILNHFKEFAALNHFSNGILKIINKRHFRNNEVIKFIDEYNKKWYGAEKKIARNVYKSLDIKNKTILLHSNSNTITEFFKYLIGKKIPVNIIQTESKPECEGKIQAYNIKKLGFKVKLIKELYFKKYIEEINIVLFGADSISDKYFVNKKGTLLMSLVCYENHIPVYVLVDSRKINKSRKTEIENIYFEKIPNKYIKKFITERGVYSNNFRKYIAKKSVV